MDTNVTAAFQQQLAQRRANIYNMFKNPHDALGDEVVKAETDDIEKAVYADNAKNRKLGRVGQEYGGKGSRGGKTDEENAGHIKGKKEKQQKAQKITADDAAKFLSEHGEDYISYQYGDIDEDDDLYDKFEAASKFIKEFKTFDWKQEDEADEYKNKMESKGYHVIDVGNGSDTIAYALIKKDRVKKAEDDDDIEDDEDGVKKGCGDGDKTIEKENEDGDEDEYDEDDEDEDEKTDAEKAEIINIIGIDQLDAWKAQIDELAMNDTMDETEKAEAISAIDDELDGFAKLSNIRKSDILYALSGYDSKIKFRKNGKEIKEQLNRSVIPALNADLSAAQNKADELLKECGAAPTHDVPEYWTGDLKINLAYKFYEWDETRVPETQSVGVVASFSPDSYQKRCCKNAPASQEEAEARCQYNEQIRKVANITTDIKACEIVSQNLKDSESIELTVRQLVAFKFA